jgi:hypothetical protein
MWTRRHSRAASRLMESNFLLAAVVLLAMARWAQCSQGRLPDEALMTKLPASADLFLSDVLETVDPQ